MQAGLGVIWTLLRLLASSSFRGLVFDVKCAAGVWVCQEFRTIGVNTLLRKFCRFDALCFCGRCLFRSCLGWASVNALKIWADAASVLEWPARSNTNHNNNNNNNSNNKE